MSEAIATSAPLAPPIQNPQRALLWLGMLPIIGLFLAAAGPIFGLHGSQLTIHWLAVVTGVLCFMPPAVDRVRPLHKRHIFLSIFGPVFAVYFVMGIYTEYFFIPDDLPVYGSARLAKTDPDDIVMGQIAALVGLLALMFGFLMPIGALAAQLVPSARTDWPLGSTLRVALILTAIGWVIFLAGQFGVLPGFLGSGFLGAFASAFYFGASLLMLAWLRFGSKSALFVMLALLPPTMFFSFFTGSKKLFLSPLAIVAVTHIMYTRRLRLSWLAAGGILLVLIYPLASFYRDAIQIGNQLGAVEVLRHPQRVINGISIFLSNVDPADYLMGGIRSASSRLSALGILCVIVRDTPAIVPFQEGWTIGNTFIAFIPRILWPGKPTIGIGQWVTDNYGAGPVIASQTGSTWIGELYFNYGWPGIVVGMALLGVYFRFLQDACMRPRSALPMLLAGVVVLWSVMPGLQGTLQIPVNGILFSMFPVIFAHAVVRFFLGAVPYSGGAAEAPATGRAGPPPPSAGAPAF